MSLPHAKGYATVGEARRSKAGQRPGAEFTQCWSSSCGLVHVTFPKTAPARVTLLAARDTGPSKAVRELVLERDGYCCVVCGQPIGPGQHYSLADRKRRSQGGKPVPSNLITAHGLGGEACHGRIDFRRDPEDEARGLTVRSWQDPALVPVKRYGPDGRLVEQFAWDDGTWRDEPQAVAA